MLLKSMAPLPPTHTQTHLLTTPITLFNEFAKNVEKPKNLTDLYQKLCNFFAPGS
jgi:hypothetical protein